ncbi:hypothetical protein M409DRAFT_29635 [Zasmidium cellare ATCC 36951]|uniref:Uncharacterized protein n=1 Tax=Zasmidium cellare ATCC 36951 TaxID=1080233 RepID=A0A6A6BYP7_ZASCE|nr:uncharacterized protein M409DRAFT_29635 [Zasmidium cellare ATCC 36951]KAF2159825.1 hypothetical protein M409DRAFT_29635 [Zasmidium cellare ATCC 36951]
MFSRVQAFQRPSTSLMPYFIAEAVLSTYMETMLCESYDIYESLLDWDEYLTFARGQAGLLVTKCGFLCCGPVTAEEHDVVILPYGSRHPMLLRRQAEDTYTFQSFLYVFGIMEEELIKTCPDLELEEMEFKIV